MSNVPSTVAVPQVSGTPQALIDNVTVSTSASANAQRQVTALGDPANGANIASVNANGGLGVTPVPLSASQLLLSVLNNAAGGDIPLVAAVGGKSVKLYRLLLFATNPTLITFKDGSTPLSGPIQLLESGSIVLDFSGDPWYQSSVGATLNINSSVATQISGTAWYEQN